MKRLLALGAALVLALTLTTAVNAGPPWGNDDEGCHGANATECRPDPQPDHGKDCLPHGQGGVNEDHCLAAGPTPVPTPAATPTPTPSSPPATSSPQTPSPTPTSPVASPTPTPSPTGSLVPPITSEPTLPPTSTSNAVPVQYEAPPPWFSLFFLGSAIFVLRRLAKAPWK